MSWICILPVLFASTLADDGVFDISYPSAKTSAQLDGNVTLQSGNTKDLYIDPGPGGKVMFDEFDLLHIIQIAKSLPPVWLEHSHVNFFGTFTGEDKVDIKLEAVDPEAGKLRYQLVAGDLPPGIYLNGTLGTIHGVTPDLSAIFSFTIRAIDFHNKYADAVFKMETVEMDHCQAKPCRNGGICYNRNTHFHCNCTSGYGGEACENACRNNALGIGTSSRRIPDAQLSGYLTLSTSYPAQNGRYGGGGYGWCGNNNNAWFQVDLGNVTDLYKVTVQGYTSNGYYTTSYTLATSINGNVFSPVNDTNGNVHTFSAYYGIRTYDLPVVTTARFVRFHPTAYRSHPCLKVELYGCKVQN